MRPSLYAVVFALLIEGFFRNLTDNPGVLLVKDVLIGLIYIRVFGGRLIKGQALVPSTPLNGPLLAFCVLVALQCFNPNVIDVGQALVGIRSWLYYVPLFYVALEAFDSEAKRSRLVLTILAASILLAALASGP